MSGTMSGTKQCIYHFGEFHLEAGARLLARKGQRVPLGSKAFEVLLCLVQHSGEVVSKDVLLKTVWPNSYVEENNLSQHIFSLRKALADRADYIVTVPGRGYQFAGRVLEIAPAIPRPQVAEALRESALEPAVMEAAPAVTAVVAADAVPATVVAMTPEERGGGGARRWAMWSVAVVVVAALLGWGGWMRPRAAKRVDRAERTGVVLAEFNNTTGDATFDRTLKRALEIELEQSPNIDVVSEREAMIALEGMGRRSDEAITPEVARAICERGKGQVLVAGSIASVGGEYLVTVQATDCQTGKELASAKAEAASKEKVLGALDKIVDRVGSTLGEGVK